VSRQDAASVITHKPATARIPVLSRAELESAAQSHAKVLITGEPGSDRSMVARLLHDMSRRAERPFVAVNCAELSDLALETALFGEWRVEGPDGPTETTGLFEQAANGTVFLDEVGEIGAEMQKALTRFLATGEIRRVGSSQVRQRVDVRLITATSQDLYARVEDQAFREDLYYRLNVIRMEIPALAPAPALPC
jgi:DNA-binding NtrC family response regulator